MGWVWERCDFTILSATKHDCIFLKAEALDWLRPVGEWGMKSLSPRNCDVPAEVSGHEWEQWGGLLEFEQAYCCRIRRLWRCEVSSVGAAETVFGELAAEDGQARHPVGLPTCLPADVMR